MRRLIQKVDYAWTEEGLQKHVDIGLDGSRIAFVGQAPADFAPDEVVYGKNRLAMPGFVNTHTHLPMTVLRSCADGYPFHVWLFEKIMPAEDRLNEETVYWASMLGIAEMLRGGTTSFLDMYFFSEAIAKAVGETGMRASITCPLVSEDTGAFAARVARVEQLIRDCHGACDGRLTVNVAPHAVYTNTLETLAASADIAREHGLLVHTHLSETQKENDDCLQEYGKSPTRVMLEAGLFDGRAVAAHCVYLSDEDMDILSERGVCVAHNPTSNLKLGNGIAPVKKMQEKGICVALGTDGTASNNNLDMLEEMNLAGLLMCGTSGDPAIVQSEELIEMATARGARAVGTEDVGTLRVGNRADLILLDIDKPHFCPHTNILNSVCFSANAADVDTVFVDGRLMMKGRELVGIDLEKVQAEVERCAKKLFA